ncbi:MAG: hypothetical protein SFU86_08120 [Pirellulaceae bacterium]|nr:hypothetical protein [Pirellulaceae bacterium]
MLSSLNKLIARYRERGLLVDTNLLLLLLVGAYDLEWIGRFKRTRTYTPSDYTSLNDFARQFTHLVVTTNILTEASNLLGERQRGLPPEFYAILPQFIRLLKERQVASAKAVELPCFQWLGLADSVVASLGPRRHLVITDDLDLYRELLERKFDVLNFAHYRPAILGLD